tara:strand:- start:320 stop:865 length:546 start_codon:yes stop_codon:yes gene_type:complete
MNFSKKKNFFTKKNKTKKILVKGKGSNKFNIRNSKSKIELERLLRAQEAADLRYAELWAEQRRKETNTKEKKDFSKEKLSECEKELSECKKELSKYEKEVKKYKKEISKYKTEISNELICPITQELFIDPVIAEDGQVYEREAIEEWFRTYPSTRSPITRERIGTRLMSVNQIKNLNKIFK